MHIASKMIHLTSLILFILFCMLIFTPEPTIGGIYGKKPPKLPVFGKGRDRVVGDTRAALDGEFPHQVSIIFKGKHFCGGTIFNETIIISAAHCFYNEEGLKDIQLEALEVVAGIHYQTPEDNPSESTQRIGLRDVLTHPCYNEGAVHRHDLALLILKRKLTYSKYVKPLRIQTLSDEIDDKFIVIGWGRTSEEGENSDILLKISVPLVPFETCSVQYSKTGSGTEIFSEEMVCAGKGGEDACRGDSGGPLLVNRLKNYTIEGETKECEDRFMVGVVSYGVGCGKKEYPGIYMNVIHYSCWIKTGAWQEKCRDSYNCSDNEKGDPSNKNEPFTCDLDRSETPFGGGKSYGLNQFLFIFLIIYSFALLQE